MHTDKHDILAIALVVLLVLSMVPDGSYGTDSAMRIVGDRGSATQKRYSSGKILLLPVAKKRSAIRIIGGKVPAAEEHPKPGKSMPEIAPEVSPPRSATVTAAGTGDDQERLSKKKADKESAVAAEARLAAEQKEQQAAEARKVAAMEEQEHLAVLREVEERLLAQRKAASEKSVRSTDHLPVTVTPFNNYSGQPARYSVEDIWVLYQMAKANDPALARTRARVTANRADADMVLSGLLPHIDAGAGVKWLTQTTLNYPGSPEQSSSIMGHNYSVSARLTLLHVPTLYNLAAAESGLKSEEAGVAVARQHLIVRFSETYYGLLKAYADEQIAREEIARLKLVLAQTEAFLQAGTGDIIAVYEARSRLDNAKAELNKSESALHLAEQKLSSLVGKQVELMVDALPQPPKGPEPDDLEWWLASMEKEHPQVKQARESLAQTLAQRKSAMAEYFPVLQASGGYDVSKGSAFLPDVETRQWSVGATLSLPLYSGGETSARIRRSSANEEERRHMLEEILEQQRDNVKQGFFNLRYNVSIISALEQKKKSAELQLDAVKKGRSIGTRSAIDLLNAEQAYSMALRDLRNALYDNVTRVIQLRAAAGLLEETDLVVSRKAAARLESAPALLSR
jgi:outer membrane protein